MIRVLMSSPFVVLAFLLGIVAVVLDALTGIVGEIAIIIGGSRLERWLMSLEDRRRKR